MTDSSKPATSENLELLGWDDGFNDWDGWQTHQESNMAFDPEAGNWFAGGFKLHPRLAPRTLAEVKNLMDRMMGK